jgi:hypothetical protein
VKIKNLYLISHLQRGGGHAIIDFVVQNHKNIYFYNLCTPTFLRRRGTEKGIRKGKEENVIISFENQPPSEIESPKIIEDFNFERVMKAIVLRDPFNWWASSNAANFSASKDPNLWKRFANNYRNPKDWLPVSFNDWFVSDQYRKDTAKRLHLKDWGLPIKQRLCEAGQGSSFQKKAKPKNLDLLRRWKTFVNDAEFQQFCKDSEITCLSEEIFGLVVPPLFL